MDFVRSRCYQSRITLGHFNPVVTDRYLVTCNYEVRGCTPADGFPWGSGSVNRPLNISWWSTDKDAASNIEPSNLRLRVASHWSVSE